MWTQNPPVFVPAPNIDLPVYSLPETLGIGQYTMIFQVVGKDNNALFSTEKPFYFLDDARFSVKELQMYLPDQSDTRFAKAGAQILLEVPVMWDERLDPYIVWSEGGKEFSSGKLSEGANRILWKVPKLAGFKHIRADVFPFLPIQKMQKISGITRIISIPVTAKGSDSGHFTSKTDEFTYWYRLQGELLDETGGTPLLPQGKTNVQWIPTANTYGLGIGADAYLIPNTRPAAPVETEPSGVEGIETDNVITKTEGLLFRLKLLEEGIIMSGRYNYIADGSNSDSVTGGFTTNGFTTGGLTVRLVFKEGNLELLVNMGEEETLVKKISAAHITNVSAAPGGEGEALEKPDFLIVRLNFRIGQNQLFADMSLENAAVINTEPVTLPKPLSGMATFQLGSGSGSTVAVIKELGVALNRPAYTAATARSLPD
jgi:hypothetical protein